MNVEFIIHFYEKYLQRANISTDITSEMRLLENYIDSIIEKTCQYRSEDIEDYKILFAKQISILYKKAIHQIQLIDRFSNSHTLKNRLEIPDKELFIYYKNFCEYIKKEYNIRDDKN